MVVQSTGASGQLVFSTHLVLQKQANATVNCSERGKALPATSVPAGLLALPARCTYACRLEVTDLSKKELK